MTDDIVDIDAFAKQLEGVTEAANEAAASAASAPTAPSGKLEAELRKTDASGCLVRMANGDVLMVPVVEYTGKYFMAADGRPDVMYERKTKGFHAELEQLLNESDSQDDGFDVRRFLEMVYHIFKENYPDATVDHVNTWLGDDVDINDEDGLVMGILRAFRGMSKN